MTPLLTYLAKVVIVSGILYGYYYLALRNNRFHQWNRYYLLFCAILSLIVPLLRIPLQFAPEETSNSYTGQVLLLREQVFTPAAAAEAGRTDWAFVLYSLVALLCVARVAWGYWKILRLIRHSRLEFIRPYWLVLSDKIGAPFSFFRYIFWNSDSRFETPEYRKIFRHEMVHVQERHSNDKLFMEAVTALCWVNPFFHLMKAELALIHEFIADKKAVAGGDVAEYAQSILQMALQSRHDFQLTNNFSHHPIKRRILMLTASRRLRFSYLRRLLILPLAAIIFCSLAFVVQEQQVETRAAQTAPADTIKPPPPPAPPRPNAKPAKPVFDSGGNEVFTFVEIPPSFPGGEAELAKYLSTNIRYPKEAVDKNLSGTVFVSFIVSAKGKIDSVRTVGTKKGGGLEEEAIRVVKEMPDWRPGKQNGRQVAVMFNLPIRFTLAKPEKKGPDGVYTRPEKMPSYTGGEGELHQHLRSNIRYPKEALDKRVNGTVLVSFVVMPDGSLKDVKPAGDKVLGSGLEEEAVRIVNIMPAWEPGREKGEAIATRMVLPIRFSFQ
ncbi:TonB family protein [Chitinophaga lutea]